MYTNQQLAIVDHDHIDWESMEKLPEEALSQLPAYSFSYPSFIHGYHNGIAGVQWLLIPDGRYWMDDDGYVMTSETEFNIYGFIGKQSDIISKFHYYTNAELEAKILDKIRKDVEIELKNRNKKPITMKRLYSLIIMAVAIFSTAYAQTQLTVTCEDTREPFEATVPDGLKIYQYNGNWLDSIPYLMENVRNKEPWAYEALAECYRYGKGVDKSITNAMIYYDESNVRAGDLAEKAYESDPTDELGFMNHLMEELDKKRMTIEEAISLIDKYPAPLPKWAVRMKSIFDNQDVDDLEGYIKSLVDLDNDSADELVASLAALKILRPDTPTITAMPPSSEVMRNLTLAGKKIPMLFSIAADKYWSLYEDCPNDEQAMKNAFELYHKAYLHGLLHSRGAVEILDYRDNNQLYEGFPFTKEEMDNLDRFYSKEYRIHFKAPCVIEEEVEYDDEPVVLESEAYK